MDKSLKESCLKRLWAKTDPFYPLFQHLIDVGNGVGFLLSNSSYNSISEKLSCMFGTQREQTISWSQYICSMHDIGKCHPLFQGKFNTEFTLALKTEEKIPNNISSGFRHETFSDLWIYNQLKNEFGWKRADSRTIGAILHGHHGNYFSTAIPEPENAIEFWEQTRREFASVLIDIFRPPKLENHFIKHRSNIGVLLSGLCVLSDWVASNSELFEMREFRGSPRDYVPVSMERIEKAFSKIGFTERIHWQATPRFKQIWINAGILKLRPIQEKIETLVLENINPGLMIIEAPMGEGKTEAAIHLASHWIGRGSLSGFYFALPTAATSNQMYKRVQKFLALHCPSTHLPVKLVHGRAWLTDEQTVIKEIETDQEENDYIKEWFSPKKRSLLSPFGVGTVDQAMMSALNVKFGFLRLLGLSGKVFIIDEVHAYDAYMSCIIERLLEWCASLEIPVVMLSATLPSQKKQAFRKAYGSAAVSAVSSSSEAYPFLSFTSLKGETAEYPVKGVGKEQTVKVMTKPYLNEVEEITELISERVLKIGGVHCCIVNTVRTAQRLYQSLRQRMPNTEILLYHARFLAGRRQQIEEEVLKRYDKRSLLPEGDPNRQMRPETSLLIATQVVEQSLDVDFDEMYTEIAPVDLLLQRAGRLHRHPGRKRPNGDFPYLHIFTPNVNEYNWGSTEKVYEPFILAKTQWVLQDKTEIRLPEEIRNLVESTYNDKIDIPDSYIDKEVIKRYYEKTKKAKEKEENEAKKYLLPEPNKESFMIIDTATRAYEEEEEGMGDFFRASTRMGGNTRTLLILREEDSSLRFDNVDKKRLKELMLLTVNVPQWWIRGVTPENGYSEVQEARGLPTNALQLRMDSRNCWKGRGRDGKEITIRNDPEVGITYDSREVKED